VTQRISLVVIAKSPIARIISHTEQRGWRSLRLLSSAANSYNVDYHGENAKGEQTSMLNVFTLKKGVVRHSFGAEMHNGDSDPAWSSSRCLHAAASRGGVRCPAGSTHHEPDRP
jgi:predicted dithiol-disulfide oxidoreductase (DUF899 family)